MRKESRRINVRRLAVQAIRSGLGLVWVLAIWTSVASAESTPVDGTVLKERYKQIVEMPQIERDHLQRNVAEFEKMSSAERERYRELNRKLEENKSLATMLQTYAAWLQTLTPGQREELRKQKDSAQKLALVRKFKEEQYHPKDAFPEAVPEPDPNGSRPPEAPKPLSSSELNAMIKVLVADLPGEDQEKFAKASRAGQYLEIWVHSVRLANGGSRVWPSQELQDKLIESLKKDDRKNFIKSRKSHEREILGEMLCVGVWNHALEEARPRWPKLPDLEKVLSKLEPDEKSRLESLPLLKKRRDLTRLYFDQRGDNTFKQINELRGGLERLMSQLNLPTPLHIHEGLGSPLQRRGDHGGSPDGRGNPPSGDRPRGDRSAGSQPPGPPPGPPPGGREGRPNGPRDE